MAGGGKSIATPVSAEEFSLDTSNFDSVISKARSLANKMGDLKNELDGLKNDLMFTWAGKGRNTFEKKYRLLSQQFGDLKDDLHQIAEDLLATQEEYIQADTDLSKALDGQDSRY